ncbi:MAG: IS66 family transposase, partial [Leptospirales bacterium]
MQTPEILPQTDPSAPSERTSSSEELLHSNRHCLTCPHTQTLSWWEERHKKDQEIIASRDNEIVELKGTIRSLKKDLYGKKSEKGDPPSSRDAPEGDSASDPKDPAPPLLPAEVKELMHIEEPWERPKRKKGHQPGRKSPGRTRHTELPASVEVHEPSEKDCPSCHAPFAPYGSPEETDITRISVQSYKRKFRRPRYRKTWSCQNTPRIAIAPNRPSSRSPRQVRDLGLGHGPDRQVRHQSPHGQTPQGPERQGTLSGPGPFNGLGTDGPGHVSGRLKPLYDKIVDRSRTASFSQADETRYYVFGDTEGKTNNSKTSPHRWWLWIILTLDTVVYVIDPSRSSKVPLAHFADRACTLLTDRFSAYKYAAARIVGLVLAFCWAHVRRDFIRILTKHPSMRPWVAAWISRIRKLYRLGKEPENRIKNRDALVSHLAFMKQEAEKDLHQSLPSPAIKAVKSLLRHWDGLTLFLDR